MSTDEGFASITTGRGTGVKPLHNKFPVAKETVNRELILDYLRGIAALLVFFYHIGASYRYFTDSNISYFGYGWVGVDIFFIISGYVITQSAIRRKHAGPLSKTAVLQPIRFIWDRFFRIYPPFIAACFLAWFLDFASPWASVNLLDSSYPTGIRESLMLFGNPVAILNVAWTLRYEIVFYLVMSTYLFPGMRFWSLIFLLCVGVFLEPGRPPNPDFNYYSVYFLLGTIFAFTKFKFPRAFRELAFSASKCKRFVPVGFFVFAGVSFVFAVYNLSRHHTLRAGIGLWVSMTLLIVSEDILSKSAFIFLKNNFIVKICRLSLAHLGAISYSLYLVHWPLITCVFKFLPLRRLPLVYALPVVLPVVVAVATIFHYVFENYSVQVGRKLAAALKFD